MKLLLWVIPCMVLKLDAKCLNLKGSYSEVKFWIGTGYCFAWYGPCRHSHRGNELESAYVNGLLKGLRFS